MNMNMKNQLNMNRQQPVNTSRPVSGNKATQVKPQAAAYKQENQKQQFFQQQQLKQQGQSSKRQRFLFCRGKSKETAQLQGVNSLLSGNAVVRPSRLKDVTVSSDEEQRPKLTVATNLVAASPSADFRRSGGRAVAQLKGVTMATHLPSLAEQKSTRLTLIKGGLGPIK